MSKIIIPFLVSALVLGLIVSVSIEDVYAPRDSKPKHPVKLSVESVNWDANSQDFVIEFLANNGIAQAAQNADFILSTKLNGQYNGGKVDLVASLTLMPDFEYTKGKVATTFSTNFPCESCSDIQGLEVDITVNAQILNPAGKPVATAEPETFEIEILPPPTCEVACSEQSCCEEREDCAWYNGDAGFCGAADEPPCEELNQEWCNDFPDVCVWLEIKEHCIHTETEPPCHSDSDCADEEICDDGIDNDENGRVDCEDLDCSEFPACIESPVGEVCDNGRDDDGDSLEDCFDSDCADNPVCGPR